MGIIAQDMAEAFERSKNDVSGIITDLRAAKVIELVTGPHGNVWVNVDGLCVLRIQRVETVIADTSNALSTDKIV